MVLLIVASLAFCGERQVMEMRRDPSELHDGGSLRQPLAFGHPGSSCSG
jgi:hypothetical protein